MKKVIALTIAIILTFPRGALCLRPMATKASSAGQVALFDIPRPEYEETVIAALEKTKGNVKKAASILEEKEDGLMEGIDYMMAVALAGGDTATIMRLTKAKISPPTQTRKTIEALEKARGDRLQALKILGRKKPLTLDHIIDYSSIAASVYDDRDAIVRLRKACMSFPEDTEEILWALENSNGNYVGAADKLDMAQATLSGKIVSILAAAIAHRDTDTIIRQARASIPLPKYKDETIEALRQGKGSYKEAAIILNIDPSSVSRRVRTIYKRASARGDTAILMKLTDVLNGEMVDVTFPKHAGATIEALEEKNGIREEAAEILGITPSAVSVRIRDILAAAIIKGKTDVVVRLIKASISLPWYAEETLKALEEAKGNQTKAAEILTLDKTTISRRIKTIRAIAVIKDDTDTLVRLAKASISLPKYTNATIRELEKARGGLTKAAKELEITLSELSRRIKLSLATAIFHGYKDIVIKLNKAIIVLPEYTELTIEALRRSRKNPAKADKILEKEEPDLRYSLDYMIRSILARASARGDNETLDSIAEVLPPDMYRAKASSAGQKPLFDIPRPEFEQATIDALKQANGNYAAAASILETAGSVSYRVAVIAASAYDHDDTKTVQELARAKTTIPAYAEATILALEQSGGNKAEAAAMLGTDTTDLEYRIAAILVVAHARGDRKLVTRVKRAIIPLPKDADKTLMALQKAGGNRAEAASELEISLNTVDKRIITITAAAYRRNDKATIARLPAKKIPLPKYTEATIDALEKANGRRQNAGEILEIHHTVVTYRIEYILAAAYTNARIDIIARMTRAMTPMPEYTEVTIRALVKANGNITKAAEELTRAEGEEISRAGIERRIAFITVACTKRNDADTLERLRKAKVSLPKDTEKTLTALENANGRRRDAARELGIHVATVGKRIVFIIAAAYEQGNTKILERFAKVLPQSSQQAELPSEAATEASLTEELQKSSSAGNETIGTRHTEDLSSLDALLDYEEIARRLIEVERIIRKRAFRRTVTRMISLVARAERGHAYRIVIKREDGSEEFLATLTLQRELLPYLVGGLKIKDETYLVASKKLAMNYVHFEDILVLTNISTGESVNKDLLTFLKSRSIDIPLRFEQGLFVTRDRKGRYAIRGRDYNIHQLNLDERHGMAAPSAGFFDFRNRVVLGAEELLNEGERFVLEAHVHLAGTGSSSVKVPSSEDIENFIINGLPATHIIFDEEGKGRLFLPKRRDVGWIARTSTALRFIEEESEKLEYLAAHYTIRDVVDFKIVEHEVLRHDRAGVVTRPTNQVTLGLATAA